MPHRLSRRSVLFAAPVAALAVPFYTARATSTRPVSTIVWSESVDGFGGFSGIELTPDRREFLAVSDQGYVARGALARDADGRLEGATLLETHPLREADGDPVGPRTADAEGLAMLPEGGFLVAYEGERHSRVDAFAAPGTAARTLGRHPDWRAAPPNMALESLAIDGRGAVYGFLETPATAGFALYRLQPGRDWTVIGHLPARDDFVPVGADFGPDGALYVLERKFRVAFFATRILRLQPGAWDRPETLVETGYGVLDNHEGISVTADATGRLWATTISDDNLNRFQRTEISEFLLG